MNTGSRKQRAKKTKVQKKEIKRNRNKLPISYAANTSLITKLSLTL